MSSPADWYNSLPLVSKAYGTLCLITTVGYQLGLVNPYTILLDFDLVIKKFQIWRLFTNFLFLGPFSFNFAIRLLMVARYGVQLEKGPFDRRTADFLWMMIFGAISLLVLSYVPFLKSYFLGQSLVFMLPYIWSREYPTAQINFQGLFTLKGFYLPWAMTAMNMIFGASPIPDIMGIIVGHLYYFLTVLHPRSGGRNLLKTPNWIHKLVARWNVGTTSNASAPSSTQTTRNQTTQTAFRGRSYRLGG